MKSFEEKRILITGGTGSFGKWLTQELMKYNPKEIRIYSRDEEKQLEMQRIYKNKKIKFIIGNVRDYSRLLEATQNVDLIFHAAALKIVPMCENHPLEGIKTNIIGTLNTKKAAINCSVEKSILISTDKAVKAINLYGMTKGIAEKIWINNEFDTKSKFAAVRYGNVIGSRGSVIPYFKQLINEGRALTITHPYMTRFLITLREAMKLVFYAIETMSGGEIFVPKLPSCNILDLAKGMAGKNYPINLIGIRPGEKIHECLIQEDEFRRTEETDKYYVIHNHGEYKSEFINKEFTSENAIKLSEEEIKELLRAEGWIKCNE